MGLAISQRLVRLMGGDIGFESVLGVGTNFHFSIPCTPVDGLELPTATAVAELKGLRVLVIDDNDHARQILASMVMQFGWVAHEAFSGVDALRLLTKAKNAGDAYDVVLVDWRMPEMDGWETTEHLRQFYADSIAPLIIMVTAVDRSKTTEQQQQLSSQLDGFLVKPITASMLFDAVADARTGRNAMSVVKKINTTLQRLVGLRILVVEDNLTSQQVACELLRAEGAVVTVANNGRAAIQAVEDTTLDVVIMDIQMPDMDGYTATREIRKSISKEILPIIALTANALATDRVAAIEAGMNDHVGKPFDLTQLVTVISSQISRIADAQTVILSPHDSSMVNQSKLDVQGALERFSYNKNIYANALLNFGHDASPFLTQLSGLILTDIAQSSDESKQSKNQDILRRILHALKGLSGTIGAIELATIITNAENISMQEFAKEWSDFKVLIEQIIQQAERSAHQMNILSAEKNSPSASTQLEKRQSLTDLQSFRLLLRDSNMQALKEYEQLKQKYAVRDPAQFNVLTAAMNQLNFSEALRCCEALIKLWEAQST
ncbi:MAG: response regulator [Candidatus Saccharibacteria bacterium]|nr:response regulator [Moraxellaceae bacterium]